MQSLHAITSYISRVPSKNNLSVVFPTLQEKRKLNTNTKELCVNEGVLALYISAHKAAIGTVVFASYETRRAESNGTYGYVHRCAPGQSEEKFAFKPN